MNKIYIASGWFNEKQQKDLNNIKALLEKINIPYFSPKDECLVSSNAEVTNQEDVFTDNIIAIKDSPFIVANTRDKDVGTIFECGVAYSNSIPIIYYCEGLTGNFNIMLSRSGIAVSTNLGELEDHIIGLLEDESYYCEYKGKVE
tara:strand:- start:203 stop:637 length:435 start_codon:yes stop_codon:yes gene_type:complete